MPHGRIPADQTVELGINDEDNAPSLDVVMAQVLVYIDAPNPACQIVI